MRGVAPLKTAVIWVGGRMGIYGGIWIVGSRVADTLVGFRPRL